MTVEFEPKSHDCFSFGAPNAHWFALLAQTDIRMLLGAPPMTNDPLDVNEQTALDIATILRERQMEMPLPPNMDVGMYIEFFENCQGFTTH